MASTIRNALRQTLPQLYYEPVSYTARPHNTSSAVPEEPDEWVPWTEFRRDTLSRIFTRELDKTYRGSPMRRALDNDCIIASEDNVTAACYYFIWPIVNAALNSQHGKPYYSAGSGFAQSADWLCVHGHDVVPCVAGESKINYKWNPSMAVRYGYPEVDEYSRHNYKEWQKVVGQIQGYAVANHTRYAFCVTDGGVTVFRLHVSIGVPSQVVTRGIVVDPQQNIGHQRGPSDTSMLTSSSINTTSDSDFDISKPENNVYEIPEYAFVPWNTPNENELTPLEALFFLALMAANGDNYLASSYPRLNSYRLSMDGSYVHNTSGRTASTLPHNATHDEPGLYDPRDVVTHEYEESDGLQETGDIEESDAESASRTEHDLAHELGESSSSGAVQGAGQIPTVVSTGYDEGSEYGQRVAEKRVEVVVKKHMLGSGHYYVTPLGKKLETQRSKWTKVTGGYELVTKQATYFAERFPR